MSEEHHRNRNIFTKDKSPFLVTWDIFLLSYEDDVTLSRMPDNEVMMFVMRLLGSLLSLVSLSAPWLLTDPLDCLHLTRTRGNAVHSAPRRQPCGQWPQSSHASFVHESGLWHFFNKSAWYFCPLCIAPWGLCVIWVRESWVSVSQHSAKSHELMTVLFVEILPEKECNALMIVY